MRDLIEVDGAGSGPGLNLWHQVDHLDSVVHRTGWVPSYWTEQEGEIRHLVGPQYDHLYFAYPLSGTFDFSVDVYHSRPEATEGHWELSAFGYLGYGGLLEARNMVWTVSLQDRVFPSVPISFEQGYVRFKCQVEPERIRFFLDGQLYYEESGASPTSPWLTLGAWRYGEARFRDLQLGGTPEIPREVRLTHQNRLDGWISSFYLETQPRQPRNADRQPRLNIMPWADPKHADWYADSGVIYGRQRSVAPNEEKGEVQHQLFYQRAEREEVARAYEKKPIQSRLYYHRPLRDGDSLSYEFVYEPGKTEVNPVSGA